MSTKFPQVFEGQLDAILSGAVTDREMLKNMLRGLLLTRRRYNDPTNRNGQTSDSIGGAVFSNYWTTASQIARVENAIQFLTPIVGGDVGFYPSPRNADGYDTMGNFVPAGFP